MFILLTQWRIRLKISPEICKSPDSDIYFIKVVNHSKVRAVDFSYSIDVIEWKDDHIGRLMPAILTAAKIVGISPYDSADEEKKYAIRISFKLNDATVLENRKTRITFNCQATNIFSNTKACFYREYSPNDIKCGVFETGKSMNIIESSKANH